MSEAPSREGGAYKPISNKPRLQGSGVGVKDQQRLCSDTFVARGWSECLIYRRTSREPLEEEL